jgi:hypothetical protein
MHSRRPTFPEATPERMADEDTGTYQERAGRRDAEHVLHCWDEPSGQGFRLRQELEAKMERVDQKVGVIEKKLWKWSGGIAVLVILVGVLGPILLGTWIKSTLAASERTAKVRDDSAVIFRNAHADTPAKQAP